jgi:membrane protein required for colicin V production
MYWLDTTILILLGLAALLGAMSGLLWQLLRVVGFGVALYCSIFGNDWASGVLRDAFLRDADPGVVKAVAYGVVFLAVYLALFLITFLLERALRAVKLKAMDRLLGAGLGAVKAALILGAIFLGVASIPHPSARELMDRSAIAPVLAAGANLAIAAIPAEYKAQLQEGLNKLHDPARGAPDPASAPETGPSGLGGVGVG